MKTTRPARWVAATAVAGAFLIAVAQPAFAGALQEEEQGPGFYGRRMHGRPGFLGGPGGPGGGFMHWRMLRQLNLTEEQKEQLRTLRKAHIEKTEKEHEALIEAGRKFHEAVRALEEGSGTEEAVYAASETLAEAQAALAVARSGLRAEFMAVLTPEQQKKLDELRTEMEAFRRQRFERRNERRKNRQQ